MTTSTTTPDRSLTARIGNLDTVRGLAATGVLAAHVGFATGFTSVPLWGDWAFRMIGFVNVFFVLSGFVLFRPYAVAAATGAPWPRLGRYVTRRVFRIVPAYWVLVVVAFLVLTEIPDGWTWLRYLTFTQTYFSPEFLPGVAVAWTLTVEIVFYALLPLVALAVLRRHWRPRRTVVLLMVVGLAASIGWLSQLRTGGLNVFVHPIWFPAFTMCFALGMSMAIISVARQTGTAPRWWAVADRIGSAGWLCWGVAIVFFGLCVTYGGPGAGGLPTALQFVVKELCYLGFSAFLLWPLVFGGPNQLKTLLAHPVPRFIGTVSYGLFLWHLAVLELLFRHRPGLPTSVALLLVFAGALALATISWYGVERPAQRLGDRLLALSEGRRSPASNMDGYSRSRRARPRSAAGSS